MKHAGINTVHINSDIIHITDLDPLTLCDEWSKLKRENDDLYSYNRKVNQSWRGSILRLIGIHLADKNRITIDNINSRKVNHDR